MAKLCTSVGQSRRLVELGLDTNTADMYWIRHWGKEIPRSIQEGYEGKILSKAWSLAALLGVLPKDESIVCSISFGYYNGKGEYIEKWLCAFEKEGETTDGFIIETIDGDNPVDACVAMVEKLNELNLL